jgi:hypothetical protein
VLSALVRYRSDFLSFGGWVIYLRFFRPNPEEWQTMPLLLLILAAVLVVAVLLWFTDTGRAALRGLGQNRTLQRRVLLALLVLGITLFPAGFPGIGQYLAGQEFIGYLLLATLGVMLLLFGLKSSGVQEFRSSRVRGADTILLRSYERLMNASPLLVVGGAGGFAFLAASLISWLVFRHGPCVHDTFAQLFQARLFAQGKLYAQSPPVPQFFDLVHCISDGRWYAIFPPGHPLMLALGVLVGAPWLINPLLGALTVVVIYYLGKEVYDERTARLATLLAALSPFLIFMSSEFMSHATSLFFTCLFLLFYARAFRRPSVESCKLQVESSELVTCNLELETRHSLLYALLAGLSLGVVALTRPFTGLLIGIPFALHLSYRMLRTPATGLRLAVAMLAGLSVGLGLYFAFNYLTNGSPWVSGYMVKYGPGVGLGIGRSAWGEALTLIAAIFNTNLDLNALHQYLLEWPIPGLVFVALFFVARPRRVWDWLLLSLPVMLVGGYFFYWWHSRILFGPRWEYEAFGVLILLTASGLRALPEFTRGSLSLDVPADRIKAGIGRLLAVCYLSMFAVAIPTLTRQYAGRFGFGGRTPATVRRAGLRHAVVFTRWYDEVALENNSNLNGSIVYAADLGPLNPLLQKYYPDRRFYYADQDTLRELPDLRYDGSPLQRGLNETIQRLAASSLARTDLRKYRYLYLPIAELAGLVDSILGPDHPPIVSYRQLSQTLIRGQESFDRYLPALAIWIQGDRSQNLKLFQFMNDRGNFLVQDVQFTLMGTSDEGLVLVYDVRVRG